MTFSIRFLPGAPPEEEEPADARLGSIELGDFREHFLASLEFWRAEDYERQWREALGRVLAGAETSCLITSIRDPAVAFGVAWWPLHVTGDVVRVQNAIRFFEHLDRPFDPRDPYPSVPPRRTTSEDGEPISEWVVTVEAIRSFLLGTPWSKAR